MAYVTSEKSNVDQLIGGTAVAALTKNITLKGLSAEKALKRGAVLAVSEGKYQIIDAASATPALKVANAVLAEDVVVGTGDVVATVYISGISMQRKCLLALNLILCRHTRKSCVLLASI